MLKIVAAAAAVFLGLTASAFACDVFTSTADAPGERVLTFVTQGLDFTIREDGEVKHFDITGAGTGRPERVAFSADNPEAGGFEIAFDGDVLTLGAERFEPYCD